MAVLSRAVWPISRSAWLCRISASCRRDGKALAANSAKVRDKIASLGTAPGRDQPHRRRNVLSPPKLLDQRTRRGRSLPEAPPCAAWWSGGRREVEHRLGHEGPRQGRPFGRGAAGPAMRMDHGALDARHLQHGRQSPVQRRRRTHGVIQKRQQLAF